MTKTNFNHSGIEWLGQIPKHWEIVKLNKIVNFRNGFAFENYELSVDFKIPVIRIGDIQNEQVTYETCLKTNSKSNLSDFQIKEKDILIALSGATTGKIAFVTNSSVAYINQRVAIIRSKNNEFIRYLLLSHRFSIYVWLTCYGSAQPNISTREIGDFYISLPPLNEQRQIAEFLDKKCEKISEFIAKKQRLITLLKEQKQTLINECVCGRLDFVIESERSEVSPSLRASKNERGNLKHSGVEWLGQIPKHWEVRKLKTFAKVVLGKMLCSESKQGYTHEHYLKSKNIQWLSVDTTSIEKMYFSNSEKKLYKIQKNDLLVSEGGEVGKTCIWQNELTECYLQNSVHKVTFNNNYNPRYFLYLFFAYGQVGEFDSSVSRVSIAHLTWDILINIKFIVPPLNEQRQIAEFLDKKCEKIDKAIRLVEQEINKMKEYKTSLIDKAVKGQINA